MKKLIFFAFGILFTFNTLNAQELPTTRNHQGDWRHYWAAAWITHPEASAFDYGIYHLRNQFEIKDIPDSLIVHVSGDNRYRLYVNGRSVCFGPARGTKMYWRYETVDIAPYLEKGKNSLSVLLFNMGQYKAYAQQTVQTAFILQADNPQYYQQINTGAADWKIIENKAYSPLPYHHKPGGLYAVGPGDKVEGADYPWGWQELDYDDSNWLNASKLGKGHGRGVLWGNPWYLVKRTIPMMEERLERIKEIESQEGVQATKDFLNGESSLLIPANKQVSILLDQTYLTVGYPELLVSGGKGAKIKVEYAEALYEKNDEGRYEKGNRDFTKGKEFFGNQDVFIADGGDNRMFRPLWMRTYRYIRLSIETAKEDLQILDFYNVFTAYPYERTARFFTGDNTLDQIWEVGWRTQRLCAGETYFDCPYYEQLNYTGDTRIQALITMHSSPDVRLQRDAIRQFDHSQMPCGLTQARTPSAEPLIITGYSLFLIAMIHDYWRYHPDHEFVKTFLPGIRQNLDWFEQYIDSEKNLLCCLPWWNFTDWAVQWPHGIPTGADQQYSAIINLQYVYALERAADLYRYFDKERQADHWQALADKIKKAVYEHCYDPAKGLIADTPDRQNFSQHTNVFAILTNTFPPAKHQDIMAKILDDKELVKTSYYFSFYLFEALKKSGMGDRYLELLKPWGDMIARGLTTFAEGLSHSRSDCHAWSANPLYFFMTIVVGIEPASSGFRSVRIAPALGHLKGVNARMPHPEGEIVVAVNRSGATGLTGTIKLPKELNGQLIWNGQTVNLKGGKNPIALK